MTPPTDEAPDPVEAPPEVLEAVLQPFASWITVATDWTSDGKVEHVWIVWNTYSKDVTMDQFDQQRFRNPKLAPLGSVSRNPSVTYGKERARQIWNDMKAEGFRLWDNTEKKVLR